VIESSEDRANGKSKTPGRLAAGPSGTWFTTEAQRNCELGMRNAERKTPFLGWLVWISGFVGAIYRMGRSADDFGGFWAIKNMVLEGV
jgi:hypothetical protein